MKLRTITEFKKLFEESINQEPIGEEIMYLDPTNVLGVVPKTKGFNDAFEGVFESERKGKDASLSIEDGNYQKAKFSVEYFKIITQILSTLKEDSITLKVSEDNPLIIETQHFKIILAPRVETD